MYEKWQWLFIFVMVVGSILSFLVYTWAEVLVLGETVLPCSLLQERTPEHADTDVHVSELEPGAKVLFWAAEPATDGLAKIKDWQRAYLEFANAGVTRVGADGHATFRIRAPQPLKGRLESHVHWRVCRDGGMIGPVQTTMFLP